MQNKNNDKIPSIVAALWKSKNGKTFRSKKIDAKMFDEIQQVLANVEIGGQLTFAEPSEAQKEGKSDNYPGGFIRYLTPAQVADFEQFMENLKSKSPQRSRNNNVGL